jgi:hypothetical protein
MMVTLNPAPKLAAQVIVTAEADVQYMIFLIVSVAAQCA